MFSATAVMEPEHSATWFDIPDHTTLGRRFAQMVNRKSSVEEGHIETVCSAFSGTQDGPFRGLCSKSEASRHSGPPVRHSHRGHGLADRRQILFRAGVDTVMKGEHLPSKHHTARYCSATKLTEEGGAAPTAFHLRHGEPYLSVRARMLFL